MIQICVTFNSLFILFSYIVMVRKLVKVQTIAGTSPDMLLTQFFLMNMIFFGNQNYQFFNIVFQFGVLHLAPFVYYNIEKIQVYSDIRTPRPLGYLPYQSTTATHSQYIFSILNLIHSHRIGSQNGEEKMRQKVVRDKLRTNRRKKNIADAGLGVNPFLLPCKVSQVFLTGKGLMTFFPSKA